MKILKNTQKLIPLDNFITNVLYTKGLVIIHLKIHLKKNLLLSLEFPNFFLKS